MRTHIIRLERFDDVISTCDKMLWAKSPRILLVMPERSTLFSRPIELTLALRRSQELGAQLGLVSRDPVVRDNARQVGLPIFDSVESANQKPWRRSWKKSSKAYLTINPEERKNRLGQLSVLLAANRYGQQAPLPLRLIFFFLGILAVLSLAVFFLPSASIGLSVSEQEQAVTFTVLPDPDLTAPTLTGGIPAFAVNFTVSGEMEITSSGSVSAPDQPAIGTAQFTNLSASALTLPAGTVVLSSGSETVRFRTLEITVLPADPGSQATVPVSAMQPGTQGNLPAGSLASVEGVLGAQVAVTNPEPFTGGSNRTVPAPLASDYARLESLLRRDLDQKAVAQFQSNLQPGQLLLPGSLHRVSDEEQLWTPDRGAPGDRLKLKLEAHYEGLYILEEDLRTAALFALNANTMPGFMPVEGSLQLSNIPDKERTFNSDSTVQDYSWQLTAARKIRAELSPEATARLLAGKSRSEAKQLLKQHADLSAEPIIEIWPVWWQQLPYLAFRIQVEMP